MIIEFINSNVKYAKKIFLDSFIKVAGIVLNILIFFLCAKLLDQNNFGKFQGSIYLLYFLCTLLVIGLDFRVFKKANQGISLFVISEIKSIFLSLILISLCISFLIILFIGFYNEKLLIYTPIVLCIPMFIGINIISEYFRGLGQSIMFQLLNHFLLNIFMFIGLTYFYYIGHKEIQEFIFLYSISVFIIFLFSFYLLKSKLFFGKFSFQIFINAIKKSNVYNYLKISGLLFIIVDILIISALSNGATYSLFIFGQKIGQLPAIFLTIINIFSTPKLVNFNENNLKKFTIEYRSALNLIFIFIVIIIPIYLYLIDWFIASFFVEYYDSIYLIYIYFFANILNLTCGPLASFLTFTKIKKKVLKINLVVYSFYIIFSLSTFEYLGIYALAYGYVFMIIISNIYLGYHFFKLYKWIPFCLPFIEKK